MSPSPTVCFVAPVHPSPFEPRMFYREAQTLAASGYRVVYVVQHPADEVVQGVRIVALPRPRNRLERMTVHGWRAFRAARRVNADVYHFPSPEFIPFALLLKLGGKRVIYDAHEAYRDKLATRDYLPGPLRKVIGLAVQWLELLGSRAFDEVLAADRHVARQFGTARATVVANYPPLVLFPKVERTAAAAGPTVAIYIGDLSRERGLLQMLDAMDRLREVPIELRLLGKLERGEDAGLLARYPAVRYLGFVRMEEVFQHLRAAHIGLMVFQPVPAYRYAGENTNKLFEYMASGLAIVGSDFPNLRPFIEGEGCGRCLDPQSPAAIAAALRWMHQHPAERAAMGARGRAAVEVTYNWEMESRKLLGVYQRVLQGAA